MKPIAKYKKGVTMIEMLIAIAIISILAVFSWSIVSNARKQTQVSSSCESFIAFANKARSFSLSGVAGADQVRLSCSRSAASCVIEKHTTSPAVWTAMPNETFKFPDKTNITAASIQKTYSIPYGNSAGTVMGTIQSASGSVQKNFSIDNFKAVCQ